MSLYLVVGVGGLAFALLGWSWLVAAARSDRVRERAARSRTHR